MDFPYVPRSISFWIRVIAIVPDVEDEPADPEHPLNDQAKRRAILKAWKQEKVRKYKVIVLADADDKTAKN